MADSKKRKSLTKGKYKERGHERERSMRRYDGIKSVKQMRANERIELRRELER